MACNVTLDLSPAAPAGAHLSFYWTMDEAGAADKVDSTVGLHWPLINGAVAGVGLFVNGTHCDPTLLLNQHRGLGLFGTGSVTINQATSTGISLWTWIKPLAFGPAGALVFSLDTSDVLHTNLFKMILTSNDAITTAIELQHENDTDTNIIDTPNLAWALNTWHMIALVYDKGSHTINVYVDGVLSISGADPSVYPDLTNSNFEFSNITAPGGTMDFMVDEFGLCLGGALSGAQITSLYNGGAGVTWPNITPIVPYP